MIALFLLPLFVLMTEQCGVCDRSTEFALQPHPDCSKFFLCTQSIIYEMKCAAGTLFDCSLLECNTESKVDCKSRILGEEIEPKYASVAKGVAVPRSAADGCPTNEEFVLLQHGDCSKFYICSAGIKYEMTCAPGTLFDVELQVCQTTRQVFRKVFRMVEWNFVDFETCNHEDAVTCANSCTADVEYELQEHETDCSKFFICSRGERREMECAQGTLFDYALQTCNHHDAVKCNK